MGSECRSRDLGKDHDQEFQNFNGVLQWKVVYRWPVWVCFGNTSRAREGQRPTVWGTRLHERLHLTHR